MMEHIIVSETPDGVIYIDALNKHYVELKVDDPSESLEFFCRDILDSAFWNIMDPDVKLAIKVEFQ